MMSDPLFDTTDGADAERESAEKLKNRQRIDDVREQMATRRGRRFVWSLLVASKFEGARETLFKTHGGHASYMLGGYELGRGLSDEVRTLCPEQYMLMLRENNPQPDEVPE